MGTSRVASLGRRGWVKKQKSLGMRRRNYTAKGREEEQHGRNKSGLEISICGKKAEMH